MDLCPATLRSSVVQWSVKIEGQQPKLKPLKKTIDVILTQIYDDHTICTNFKKHSLKKLILHTCTRTVFSFNNIIYEQKDGVSMGSLLGPAMANIMTKLENKIMKPLINDGTIKFYCQYVHDILLVVKPRDVS